MIRPFKYQVFVVSCDSCGQQNRSVADGFGTIEQAYADALAAGWSLDIQDDVNVDLCPVCALGEPCS